jgi:hypothetical protein
MLQPACKPNSVRRHPRPCGLELRRDDHSSSPGITGGVEQPTRRLRTGRPQAPSYLVLLRAGFCLPLLLPEARCALTAPFHPYLSTRPRPHGRRFAQGGIFSVPLVRRVSPPGCYPAHCPAEFGLSSSTRTSRRPDRRSPIPPLRLRMAAIIRPTATNYYLMAARGGLQVRRFGGSDFTHLSPVKSGIAPASCRDCSAGCR